MLEMSLYCTFGNSLFLRDSATLSNVASLSHVSISMSNSRFIQLTPQMKKLGLILKSTGDHMAYAHVVPFPLVTHTV